jgi:hypothetical protein
MKPSRLLPLVVLLLLAGAAQAKPNTTVNDNLNAADGMFQSGMNGCPSVSMAILAVNNPGIYGTATAQQRADVQRYARRCGLRF